MSHTAELEREPSAWQSERQGASAASADLKWYVLWTRSHCEQLVCNQLAAKGFHPFLPRIDMWSRRGERRCRLSVPAFPGYLFLHHEMDTHSYVEVRKARGLVRILGDGGDRLATLATVPVEEIEAIHRALCANLPAYSHPYVREGQRVRIISGPLADVEGVFVRDKPNKGLLVLSVTLLQGSVAVEVDCTQVVPV